MSFLDELNATAFTENEEELLKKEFIDYVDNVVFPYWVEREYKRIKAEIRKKVEKGEYTIENGRKVVEGKLTTSYIGEGEWIDTHVRFVGYGEADFQPIPLFKQLAFRGKCDFGDDFPCKARARIDKSGDSASVFFKGIAVQVEWNKRGLFKNRMEAEAVKLTKEFKEVCNAFAEWAQKDNIKLSWGILPKWSEFMVANFDEEIRHKTSFGCVYDGRNPYEKKEAESKRERIEYEIGQSTALVYRVEF